MLESISSIKDLRSFRVLAALAVAVLAACLLAFAAFSPAANANHSWNGYHWARTSNPFTLKLGDNLSSNWDGYLVTTSSDWSKSSVLDTTIVAGQAKGNCRPTSGRVEVCNKPYGNNGWLGLAQIWVSGKHITKGTAKMNDTYFNTSTYNKPEWKQLVVCQEVAHTFGLDHQDENFDNPNLGTCMDYTSNPLGPPDNEHPNQHDYDELVTIYSQLDSSSTVSSTRAASRMPPAADRGDFNSEREWGRKVKESANGKLEVWERDFGRGQKLITFVKRP